MDIEEIHANKARNSGTSGNSNKARENSQSKMLEENMNQMGSSSKLPDFVEIEHHHGGTSIFMKEKPYRLNSRGIILDKVCANLPGFIVNSSKFPELQKKTSFFNLSILLNDIFHQGSDIATQTYSPVLIDQLTLDKLLNDTYNFICVLFEQEMKEDLSLSSCENVNQMFFKAISRNFDFDQEQHFLKGVSFFLFIKVARLYSENFNMYALMEKLLGNIFKKNGMVFVEFVLFLYILKKREQGHHSEEIYKMRGVFNSLQYESLSEIFRRSISHVDDPSKIINEALKFFYIQLNPDLFIEISIFFIELLGNEVEKSAETSF